MTSGIEAIKFVDATAASGQLAILACPGYETALESARLTPYEFRRIRGIYPGCPGGGVCDVRLSWMPRVNKLTISGKCLQNT